MARKTRKNSDSAANLGFEEKLWQTADTMRGHMDAGEYKHIALGLIFLKYISDAFEEARQETIDMEMEVEAEEKNVGPYRADILCRGTSATSDSTILVENQVEKTSHGHRRLSLMQAAHLPTVTIGWLAQDSTDE